MIINGKKKEYESFFSRFIFSFTKIVKLSIYVQIRELHRFLAHNISNHGNDIVTVYFN